MRWIALALALGLGCGPAVPSNTVAPAATTNAPATPPQQPPPQQPPPQPPPSWWCSAFADGAVGICNQTREACDLALGLTRGSGNQDEQISDCAPQPVAVCNVKQPAQGGEPKTLCHPTFATCRSYVDQATLDNERVLRPCMRVAMPPATVSGSPDPGLDQDEAAHWWCLTMAGTGISSCHRARPLCEDGRRFLLERQRAPRDKVSDCTPQQSAFCIATQEIESSQKIFHCHPTQDLCKERSDHVKRERSHKTRLVEDCHSKD